MKTEGRGGGVRKKQQIIKKDERRKCGQSKAESVRKSSSEAGQKTSPASPVRTSGLRSVYTEEQMTQARFLTDPYNCHVNA